MSQNWATGEGLRLAKRLLGSDVEIKQDQSVYEVAQLGRTFDVILCLGVYYHLLDPFYALTQIRHCCGPGTVVVFEGDVGVGANEVRYSLGEARPGLVIPSKAALNNLLRAAYFEVRSQQFLKTGPRAWAKTALERLPGRLGFSKRLVDRALTVCVPFSGVNELHDYEPPFGLAAYDDRYRQPAAG